MRNSTTVMKKVRSMFSNSGKLLVGKNAYHFTIGLCANQIFYHCMVIYPLSSSSAMESRTPVSRMTGRDTTTAVITIDPLARLIFILGSAKGYLTVS